MNERDVEEYNNLLKKQEQAKQIEQELKAEFNMYKNNSIEIFNKYGYKNFSDLPKMEADLEKMEADLEKQKQVMLEYITYINKKKEDRDNILLG